MNNLRLEAVPHKRTCDISNYYKTFQSGLVLDTMIVSLCTLKKSVFWSLKINQVAIHRSVNGRQDLFPVMSIECSL